LILVRQAEKAVLVLFATVSAELLVLFEQILSEATIFK
jgi:hypothetical protein